MKIKQKLLLILLLLVSPLALADGPCSDGTYNPGAGVCMCPNGGSVGPNQSCRGGGNYLIPRWGAIAVNFAQSGGASFTHSTRSQDAANNKALTACRKDGSTNCKIAVTFKNTCAAMAWDSIAMGVGINDSQKQAERQAMQQCVQKGGKQCSIQITDACAGSPVDD